ncbi:cytochrome P450 [Streptomyces acidiscabies]|uniref:cytochrome P450 n=1 Tax=Streptomyces acidiscabies TaxID=42234 RepID=UPI0009514756|nr:cytochrome P450 [Streptomyces acidiscabies]GAV44541.1 putative bifunctional P-450/NADPH-P450 reductase [Streptomyces acidiscabies]
MTRAVPELSEAEVVAWRESGASVIELLGRAQRLGPVSGIRLGDRPVVLVTGAEEVRHVLARHPERYVKRSHRLRPLLGDGVLTVDGEAWRGQRRLFQPKFTVQGVRRYERAMRDAVEDVARSWGESARSGRPRDLVADMRRFTIDVIWRATTGLPLDDTTHRQLLAAARIVAAISALGAADPTHLSADLAEVDAAAERAVAAARANGDPGILDALLDAVELPDLGGRLVRDNFVTFLVAGYETTAATLSWLLLLLHEHPEHREWALAQGPAGSPARTAAIRALISETLRLYPAALLMFRNATEDDVLAGCRIEADATVALCAYLTHRDPELWPEPEKFVPQRFHGEAPRPALGTYYPLGLGPRTCLGAQFTLQEMSFLAEALLPAFEFTVVGERPEPAFDVTIRPGGPMVATVRARGGREPVLP